MKTEKLFFRFSHTAILLVALTAALLTGCGGGGGGGVASTTGPQINNDPANVAGSKTIVSGMFTEYAGQQRNYIARVNADGSLDATFDPGAGGNNSIDKMVKQPDGRILICGYFTSYNGVVKNRIARINSDGSLDATFDAGSSGLSIYSMALQGDGKIIVAGDFQTFAGLARNRIVRLNSDGSLDATFNPGVGANGDIRDVVIQADGKIIIGGRFTTFNNVARARVARINADGSLDASFDPGPGFTFAGNDAATTVRDLLLTAGGKLIVCGYFSSYNGNPCNYIVRINEDGSFDNTFAAGDGANGDVTGCVQLSDGKIVIAGTFSQFDGTARTRIARLASTGALDLSFDPGTGPNSALNCLAVQNDDKIFCGGSLNSYNAISRNRYLRINTDGQPDTTFNTAHPAGASMNVLSIIVL